MGRLQTQPGQMILVEHVDVKLCDRITVDVAHANPREKSLLEPLSAIAEPLPYTTETVHGKRFRRADGSYVTIGLTKEVDEVLGLPFEAIGDLNDRADDAHTMIWALRREVKDLTQRCSVLKERCHDTYRKLHKLQTMPWWKRLAFVWSGREV